MTTMSDRAARQARRDAELAAVHDENQRLRERLAMFESLPILPSVHIVLENTDIDHPADHESTRCIICHADTTENGAELCDRHSDRMDETDE